MKIKYQLPNKSHPTHLVIDNLSLEQIEAFINYLDLNKIDFEYIIR